VYDDFDRLISSTQRNIPVSFAYDANGNRTSVGSPGGSTGYGFNARNRVIRATVGDAATSFVYFPDGKKKTVSYPNGAGIGYTYYPTNRVRSVRNTASGKAISSYDYVYDKNGNRITQSEVQNGSTTNTVYSYDNLDRMTGFVASGVHGNTGTQYTFDGYNRAGETVTDGNGIATKSYSYDETDWLTAVVGADGKTVSYSYDANGNTARKSASDDPGNDLNFAYDSGNRLVQTTQGGHVLGQYDYDAQGMRIRHYQSDRGDLEYFYDGRSVIDEWKAGGGVMAHYSYADKLMSLATGGSTQYYHLDGLGSTVNLTDSAGGTKISYFLNPWGMILNQIGDSVNRRVFTAKEMDANTGLINFGVRYYDPDTARFISQDSYLGEPGTPPSLHRYLYAYSNPTVYIDLYGYNAWDVFKEITQLSQLP
jgi:RHS repeat-associated protein